MIPQDRLVVNAALTGMVPTREQSPHVPLTIDEIVADARRVCDAGAAIVHLHARDARGAPTVDEATWVELVRRVRASCPDVLVCVSLSGRFVADVDRRATPLASRPDLASLTLGSMNFPAQASVNAPDTIATLAARIREAGALPELEAFEPGFVHYAGHLARKGILRPPHYFNLILGSLGASPLDLAGLGHMVGLLPPDSLWAAGGIGRFQLDANVLAIAAGGHVRVGLEDNLHYDRARSDLATNPRLVERVVRIAREMGREPASPADVRAALRRVRA